MASQYQLNNVIDKAIYLEYKQAVLKLFNTKTAPTDKLLICYFEDSLRPLI